MPSTGSVSRWIAGVKDAEAAGRLWNGYFDRLVQLARRKLDGARHRAADVEDVALSAFASFFRAAEQGRLGNLKDRDDLWRLLMKRMVLKVCCG